MTSEDISLMASSPLVTNFISSIIKSLNGGVLPKQEKFTVHADMVPKFHEKKMQSSMMESPVHEKKIQSPIMESSARVSKPQTHTSQTHKSFNSQVHTFQTHKIPPRIHHMQKTQRSLPTKSMDINQEYGKITVLINDPSVSTIECEGSGIPIKVTRAGYLQKTRITLDKENIHNILEKISDESHIPLSEGVFRAIVDRFSVNAIISGIIGSKFVIKKQMAHPQFFRHP